MKLIVPILLSLNFFFSVGIHSAKLPLNATSLSVSGFGVASNFNTWINPASLANNQKTHFNFSSNSWLQDVEGSYINYTFERSKISVHTWAVDQLEQYGESPSDAPLGFFGSRIIFANYSKGFSKSGHSMGFNLSYIYMTLLELDDKGFALDFGYQKKITELLTLGFSGKNLFCDFKSGDSLPKLITLGIKKDFNSLPISIFLDIYDDQDKGLGSFKGLKYKNKFFELIGGLKYLDDFDKIDMSFGFNILRDNIKFSIATLVKNDDSIGNPVFYQVEYSF